MCERITLKTENGVYFVNPIEQQSLKERVEVVGDKNNGNYFFYVKVDRDESVDGALRLLESKLAGSDVPIDKITNAVRILEDSLIPPAKVVCPITSQ